LAITSSAVGKVVVPTPGRPSVIFYAGRCRPIRVGMHLTGTTVLRVENGKIAEEVGLDDGVTALQQLGILKVAA
jgi:hypothetical protein